jgi:hypothetical protein
VAEVLSSDNMPVNLEVLQGGDSNKDVPAGLSIQGSTVPVSGTMTGHPDVIDFIKDKREDGRLRQINLSLLITAEFMEAVKNDTD